MDIKKSIIILMVIGLIASIILTPGKITPISNLSQNSGGFCMNMLGECSGEYSLLHSTLADCKEYIHSYSNKIDDYPPAYCKAKIYISRIYGRDCTEYPYIDYAKVRVKCQGDKLYVYKGSPKDNWNTIKSRIKCYKGYCTGWDEKYSSGEHEITLKDSPGKLNSYFFVCYDYDEKNGAWCWAWAGWGYWGDREVVKSECEPGEEKCEGHFYYKCENYKWVYKGLVKGKCGVECFPGEKKCVGFDYYECIDYKWVNKGKIKGKCGVECLQGEEKCVSFDFYECVNYKWVNKGKIKGKCGVECLKDEDCGKPVISEETYCYMGDVYRNVTKYYCRNYKCEKQVERELVEKCKYGCKDGKCIEFPYYTVGLLGLIGGIVAISIFLLKFRKK